MTNWKNIAAVVCFALVSLSGFTQITIDDTQTVEWNVLNKIAGPGVAISNIRFNSLPIDQVNPQIGNFNSTSANVGLESGVILSNGNINSIIGPNDEEHFFLPTTAPAPTDPDLLALSSPEPAFDGAVLEFTFVPNGDTVEFDFVFASEEYPEFVGSATNDVFGFFVAGPGISGPYTSPNLPPFNFPNGAINVALVPGTTTPVSINNVNALTNSQYYVANGDGNTAPYNTDPQYIQADGFTTPITVKFAVQCGEQYYIKFAIGDVFDSSVDSYVFIEEDSFSTITPTEVTIANGSADLLEGCGSVTLDFTRTNDLSLPHSVNLTVSGSATNGVDYSTIPSQIDFPIGASTVSLTIDALADADSEGSEVLDIHVENFGTTFCGNPIESDISIVINDNISGVLSGGGTVCPGDSAFVQMDFTGTGPWDIEYLLNGALVTETVSDNPYIIYSSFQQEYELTQVSMNGCPGLASGTAIISVPTVPTLDVSGGGAICSGSCADAVFTLSGTPPFTVQYAVNSVTQPSYVTSDLSFTLSFCDNAVVEPISVQSLSISTCEGTLSGSATFTVSDLPTLSTPSVVGICNGNMADIELIAANGGPWTIEYNLNGVPQPDLTGVTNGFVFQTNTSGTYEFTSITSETTPFCSSDITETTIVDTFVAPTAVIPTFDTTICINSSIDIPVTFTGTAPWVFEYTINGVNQGSFMTHNDTIITSNESGSIEITSVADINCSGSGSGMVGVSIASPIGNPSSTLSDACLGETLNLTSNIIGGLPSEDYIYAWYLGSSTLSTDDNLSVTASLTDPLTPEVVNYTLIVSQASCGIDYIFPYIVETHPLPTSSMVSSDMSVCPGEEFDVDIENTGTGSLTLSFTKDGSGQSPITTMAGTNTFTFSESGTYILTEIQDTYCSNTITGQSVTLSNYLLPSATISNDDTLLCPNNTLSMPVSFTGDAPYTFDYLINGTVAQTITTSDNPYLLEISTAGIHSIGQVSDVHCSSTGIGACGIDFVTDIQVDIEDQLVVCAGETILLDPLAISGGDPNTYIFTWYSNSSIISNDSMLNYIPSSSGSILLSVHDRCNTDFMDSTTVTIEEYPIILFSVDQTAVCPNEHISLENNSIVNTDNNTVEWQFGDDLTSSAFSTSHNYTLPGDYDITLTMTTPNGCSSTDSIQDMIHVNPTPNSAFTFNPETGDMSDPEIEFQNLTEDAATYHWYFGDGDSSESENPTHIFPEDRANNYLTCLSTTNSFGCANELCKTVEIQPIFNVFIPNTFTPDGDGVNELFGPVLYTSDIDTYLFEIFDRDGNILFKSIDPSEKWNGSYFTNKNYFVADGVYPWKLRIKLKHHSDVMLNRGMITVMR